MATAVMAVKATPKALALLEIAEEEKGEKLTKFETFKVAGPVYIPAFAAGVATLACIFGANALNKRQQGALMSAYALVDQSLKDYKRKAIELYGEDGADEIKEEIAKDKYDDYVLSGDSNLQLFYDDFSGRYFESTMENVVKAEYAINRKISLWGGANLNEFYDALNIPKEDYGEQLGWSSGSMMEMAWSDWLDFEHTKTVMDDGLECYIITMSVEPMIDHEYY